MKTEDNKIIVSTIVCRADSFRVKVDEVNPHLEEICAKKDANNYSVNLKRHLDKNRLHLNDVGIAVLLRNFKASLTNLHCVKSVCTRNYSGPHFSCIFSHSD